MLSWNKRREAFAGFGYDAATVGQSDQHSVPLEVTKIRVMNIQEELRALQHAVTFCDRQIALCGLSLGKRDWDQPEMTVVGGKKVGMGGQKFFPSWRERSQHTHVQITRCRRRPA